MNLPKPASIIIGGLFIAVLGYSVLSRTLFQNDFPMPQGGETKKETKGIMITDGVKHSVPLDEIIGGGPSKDGIPSIDKPKFVVLAEANSFLKDSEPGIALEMGGVSRFYPFQILVWHEIVNDTIGGTRVLVTYCPLCLSGIVFDPAVNGERVEFGTSGKLWNSNLVMYDRKTDSLWSQILGEAIVGEMTGMKLAVLPSDMIRFGDFKKLHPEGSVLSRDTGTTRFYGQDPYGDYYTTPGTYFPVGKKDARLNEKDFVLGVVVNGKAKAYWPEAVKKAGEVTDRFEGKDIVARYEKEVDAVRLFSAEGGSASGGEKKLVRINSFGAFWFSWVAAHPETELYK
ncbi:DUF3179 domain-containing protein [Candidatus Azambacteria bacterium]|nr:DUF3179 domain-containing protein [Candidatus Azambacteria bacterium]